MLIIWHTRKRGKVEHYFNLVLSKLSTRSKVIVVILASRSPLILVTFIFILVNVVIFIVDGSVLSAVRIWVSSIATALAMSQFWVGATLKTIPIWQGSWIYWALTMTFTCFRQSERSSRGEKDVSKQSLVLAWDSPGKQSEEQALQDVQGPHEVDRDSGPLVTEKRKHKSSKLVLLSLLSKEVKKYNFWDWFLSVWSVVGVTIKRENCPKMPIFDDKTLLQHDELTQFCCGFLIKCAPFFWSIS